MSKKRQTRKQKVQASTRHDFTNVLTFGGQQIQIAAIPTPSHNSPQSTYVTHDYSYVAKDVRKTVLITSVLLGLNIAIFFLLKLSIITIPGIVF